MLLLYPLQFPLVLALFLVSAVFTAWPEALEHSPISFETRGFVHHIWHYTLLVGAALVLVGMLWNNRRRLQVELSGLFLLIGAMGMNFLAVATASGPEAPNGLTIAVRFGVIAGLVLRAWIIISEPVVEIGTITTGDA